MRWTLLRDAYYVNGALVSPFRLDYYATRSSVPRHGDKEGVSRGAPRARQSC
jgi:hypothetical protein